MISHGAGIPASLKDQDAGQKAIRIKDRKGDELLEAILFELRATNWLLAEAFKLNNPSGDIP